MDAWSIALTILLPWTGAAAVLLINRRPAWQHATAVGFCAAAAAAAIMLLRHPTADVIIRLPVGGVFGDFTFVPDGLAVFLTVIATVIGGLAVVFSVDYMRGEPHLGRYYALVLLFIGAMAGLALAGSLLLLVLFWELVGLCSFALISFHNDDPKAVAGGLKALIMTQVGGIGLIVGTLVAHAHLGTYQIADVLAGARTMPAGALGVVAAGFLVAAAAKSAQVPFHTWLPGAMEAPTPVSALIHAATMVNAGVYLLARFAPAFTGVAWWAPTVAAVGLSSALLGGYMALVATDLKRVLAYSTISQLGVMVVAVGLDAMYAGQFHLLSHAVFKALLFLSAGAVIHAVGTRDLREMGALGRQMPFVRNVFIIGAMALAGIPFLNGFWSKELIVEAAWAVGPRWPVLGMLVVTALTALYSVRVVVMVFFGSAVHARHAHDAGLAMRAALGPLALGVFSTWLLAGPFSRMLADTLPLHTVHAVSTAEMLAEVLSAPATAAALAVTGLGLVLWWQRGRLRAVRAGTAPLTAAARADFGFEFANRSLVRAALRAATALSATQTGYLNWNVVGILAALCAVLAALVLVP